MFDIIIASKVVNIGIINESAWGKSIGSFFSEIRKNGAENFASLAAKNESQFISVRDKIVANYEALE